MKIVFTTSGNDLNAPLDSRFGRAPKFLVYDVQSGDIQIIDNQKNLNAEQGAGTQAAETVIKLGAKALVTGHCGPKAFRVLAAAKVAIYNTDVPTVNEALELYRAGKLSEATFPDSKGH